MRGALTAGLLDIRLLELSGGRQGLQDLILELTRRYGADRAFPESTFVDTLVALTHPEIRVFFDRYVWESEPLPIREYYAKLGIRLVEDAETLGIESVFALTLRDGFFNRLGFRTVAKEMFPAKVWSDCRQCPKLHACDEIAVVKEVR